MLIPRQLMLIPSDTILELSFLAQLPFVVYPYSSFLLIFGEPGTDFFYYTPSANSYVSDLSTKTRTGRTELNLSSA